MLSGEGQSSSQCRQLKPWETYCPICGCVITASNIADFDLGKADGYLFVHPGGVNHNLDDIEELIKLAKEIGVTYMVNLYSWNRGTKQPRLPGANVTEHLLELKKKYKEFITLTSYVEHLDQAITRGGIGNCRAGQLLLNIDHHGNVARCPCIICQFE